MPSKQIPLAITIPLLTLNLTGAADSILIFICQSFLLVSLYWLSNMLSGNGGHFTLNVYWPHIYFIYTVKYEIHSSLDPSRYPSI